MVESKKTAKRVAGGAVAGAAIGAASPLARPLGKGLNAALDNFTVSKKMGLKDPEISRAMLGAGKDWFQNALVRKPGPYVKRGAIGLAAGAAGGLALSAIRKKKIQEASPISWVLKKIKSNPEVISTTEDVLKKVAEIKGDVKKGASEGITQAGKKFIIGSGASALVGGGVGSYIGSKAAKKKKIKESNPMLFSFTVGIHSALAKTRGEGVNILVQEGVLSPETLAQMARRSKKTMDYIFKAYKGTDTLKTMTPIAFGKVGYAAPKVGKGIR